MSELDAPQLSRQELRTAQLRRDIGLGRLAALTQWAIAGAAILTGVFALAAARAFPGGPSHHSAPSVAAKAARRDSTGGGASLQPPEHAPTQSSAPSVVSGGS